MSSLNEMAEEASRSGRIVKFQILVENINKVTGGVHGLVSNPTPDIESYISNYGPITPFKMFFGKNELNDFAKVIIDSVTVTDVSNWGKKYATVTDFDEKTMRDAVHDFIKEYQGKNFYYHRYTFVFWSLMLISVDDSMQDERLSFICDFAKLTGIGDNEMLDLVQLIKMVYYGNNENYTFKTVDICNRFKDLIKEYS